MRDAVFLQCCFLNGFWAWPSGMLRNQFRKQHYKNTASPKHLKYRGLFSGRPFRSWKSHFHLRKGSCEKFDLDFYVSDTTIKRAVANKTACNNWEFDKSIFQSTITSDFTLLCDRKDFINYDFIFILYSIHTGCK